MKKKKKNEMIVTKKPENIDFTIDMHMTNPASLAPSKSKSFEGLETFKSFKEFDEELKKVEVMTTTRYLFKTKLKEFDKEITLKDHLEELTSTNHLKIRWQWELDTSTKIKFCGMPFVFINSRAYTCH